ncbi:MAG: flagellar protein FlgN, partial [Thiotrichales bacterium]|nr:flagellar protein FlgN [Thiotrichales bacterium]
MISPNLEQAYRDEFECLDALAEVLAEEKSVLKSKDTDAIHNTIERKQSLLTRLESLDSRRRELKEKFTADNPGNDDLIKFLEEHDRTLKRR